MQLSCVDISEYMNISTASVNALIKNGEAFCFENGVMITYYSSYDLLYFFQNKELLFFFSQGEDVLTGASIGKEMLVFLRNEAIIPFKRNAVLKP